MLDKHAVRYLIIIKPGLGDEWYWLTLTALLKKGVYLDIPGTEQHCQVKVPYTKPFQRDYHRVVLNKAWRQLKNGEIASCHAKPPLIFQTAK
jgi:hypothetical protein